MGMKPALAIGAALAAGAVLTAAPAQAAEPNPNYCQRGQACAYVEGYGAPAITTYGDYRPSGGVTSARNSWWIYNNGTQGGKDHIRVLWRTELNGHYGDYKVNCFHVQPGPEHTGRIGVRGSNIELHAIVWFDGEC
ncbi:hypothetical protein AB0K48_29270 [Nonomuraea sp. NPDC055795]